MKTEDLIAEVRTLEGIAVHVRYHIGGKVVRSTWNGSLLNSIVLPPDSVQVSPPDAWYEQMRKEQDREVVEAFAKGTNLYNIVHRGNTYTFAVPIAVEMVSTHTQYPDDRPVVSVLIKGKWTTIEPHKIEPAIYMAAGA